MSKYLDDLDVSDGDWVVCKVDLLNGSMTSGKRYQVVEFMNIYGMPSKGVRDNNGKLTIPSGRFTKEIADNAQHRHSIRRDIHAPA